MKTVKVRATVDLKARIVAQAALEGVSASALMRRTLRDSLVVIPHAVVDLQFLLPPDEVERFKRLSDKAGCSFAGMLRAILEEGINP